MVRETSEKISIVREKMKVAQKRQKSYADKSYKVLEFEVGDHVFLKVYPIRGVVRLGQTRGKLSLCYIRPFEVLVHVEKVAYRLALPPKMLGIYNVFHINILRKYMHADIHVIKFNDIEVNNRVTYQERHVRILEHGTKKLINKEIP